MAAKIKDGLFISDIDTARSEDFINDNKVSNLINFSRTETPNTWESYGLVYMSFHWLDEPSFELGLLPQKGLKSFVEDIVNFIDVSIEHGISVLLFSKEGKCRCAVAAIIYLMTKYCWGLEKTLEFVHSKKPDIYINPGFLHQLFEYDKFLLCKYCSKISIKDLQHVSKFSDLSEIACKILNKINFLRWGSWDISYLQSINLITDEACLVCCFLNAKVNLVTLPGPFESMLYAPPKETVIKFNPIVYYEHENVLPTSKFANRRSILKKSNFSASEVSTFKDLEKKMFSDNNKNTTSTNDQRWSLEERLGKLVNEMNLNKSANLESLQAFDYSHGKKIKDDKFEILQTPSKTAWTEASSKSEKSSTRSIRYAVIILIDLICIIYTTSYNCRYSSPAPRGQQRNSFASSESKIDNNTFAKPGKATFQRPPSPSVSINRGNLMFVLF